MTLRDVAATPAQRSGATVGKVLVGISVALIGLSGYILWYAAGRSYYDEEAALHACLIGGAGVVVLLVGFAKLGRAALALPMVFGFPAIAAVVLIPKEQELRDTTARVAAQQVMTEALWQVCEGTPNPITAPYDASGFSPTVVFTKTSSGRHYPWSEPAKWLPRAVEEAQLVACVTVEEHALEYCPYTVPNSYERVVGRFRYRLRGALLEAKTGKLVAERTLIGSEPGACPTQKGFGGSNDNLYGSYPTNDEFLAVFRDHVE